MRAHRSCLSRLCVATFFLLGGSVACEPPSPEEVTVPGRPGATKTGSLARAARRVYDGSPPVYSHQAFDSPCSECHNREGVAVPGLGFAPPSPHGLTRGLTDASRCQQCHVLQRSDSVFVSNHFAGLPQDLRRGRRLSPGAPPVVPHSVFMRENCVACHTGPAAREEIRTSHPERVRCRQCHVEQRTLSEFPQS